MTVTGIAPRGLTLPTEPYLSASAHGAYWLREDPLWHHWLLDSPPNLTENHVIRREIGPDGRWHVIRTPLHEPSTTRPGRRAWNQALNSEHVRRVLAALHAFKHATSRQLVSATQMNQYHITKYVTSTYRLGMLRRGQMAADQNIAGRLPYLWSLNTGRTLGRLLSDMEPDVLTAVLGPGQHMPKSAGRHVRHDLITYETVLRTIETQPAIVATTGEPSANTHTLLPTFAQHIPSFNADAVLHRHDHLRICIETAASHNPQHLRHTIRKWAQILSVIPRSQSGLAIIIYNTNVKSHARMNKHLRAMYVEETAEGTLQRPDGTLASRREVERARAHIYLASYLDWYPKAQTISAQGRWLHVAHSPDGHTWTAIALADAQSYRYLPEQDYRWPLPAVTDTYATPPYAADPPMYGPDDIISGRPSLPKNQHHEG